MLSSRQFNLRHVFIVVTLSAVALGILVKPTGRNVALLLFGYLYAFAPLFAVSFADPRGSRDSGRRTILGFLVGLFAAGTATVCVMFPNERLLALGSLALGTIVVWTSQYALWRGLAWIVKRCFPSVETKKDALGH